MSAMGAQHFSSLTIAVRGQAKRRRNKVENTCEKKAMSNISASGRTESNFPGSHIVYLSSLKTF